LSDPEVPVIVAARPRQLGAALAEALITSEATATLPITIRVARTFMALLLS
jgi:hypothetical protein